MNWGVRVVESVDELEGLARTWTDLLAVQEDPSLFLTPEWQISWFEAMRGVATPAVVVVEDADGAAQAGQLVVEFELTMELLPGRFVE